VRFAPTFTTCCRTHKIEEEVCGSSSNPRKHSKRKHSKSHFAAAKRPNRVPQLLTMKPIRKPPLQEATCKWTLESLETVRSYVSGARAATRQREVIALISEAEADHPESRLCIRALDAQSLKGPRPLDPPSKGTVSHMTPGGSPGRPPPKSLFKGPRGPLKDPGSF